MKAAVVRTMRDDEAEAVIATWHAAGVTRPWNDPRRDLAFALQQPHSTVLVADLAGRIVASAMVGEDGHRGWVYYLAVDPAFQGGGLGARLMQAAEDWLARRGVWKIQVLIRSDNPAAGGFYEKLGFRDTHSICLQKPIGPG